jgi:hypothetical protein
LKPQIANLRWFRACRFEENTLEKQRPRCLARLKGANIDVAAQAATS